MDVHIILSNLSIDSTDESIAKNIENRDDFSYVDGHLNHCRVIILDKGLILFEKACNHSLELKLGYENCAKIITNEGVIEISLKIVDFMKNDDILVMRYQIEDETYELKIIYRS